MAEDVLRAKSLNNAADLAESQLARAVQVAKSAGFAVDGAAVDGAVIAAVLQAIVVNHWKYMR